MLSQRATKPANQSLCEFPCFTFNLIDLRSPGRPRGNRPDRTGGVTASKKLAQIGAAPREYSSARNKQLNFGSQFRIRVLPIKGQHPGRAKLQHLPSNPSSARKKVKCSSFGKICVSMKKTSEKRVCATGSAR